MQEKPTMMNSRNKLEAYPTIKTTVPRAAEVEQRTAFLIGRRHNVHGIEDAGPISQASSWEHGESSIDVTRPREVGNPDASHGERVVIA